MITCIHQRRNGLTYFDVPVQQSFLEILSVTEYSMVPQYLQMNIGHMTNWKNMDSYTKVSIIHKKNMRMVQYMSITVNAEATCISYG